MQSMKIEEKDIKLLYPIQLLYPLLAASLYMYVRNIYISDIT